ncbi:ABC transporter ATP-binding protein [Halalkalibacter krulwichiae]|uniref:Oligopeptide transport ATP-binding protein OppD n=1 Tax=Halalkalibacter krulwichiae TaxID=199441 RepID=A0A1X9MLD0_9BACI|nr:ABC transporter ATP-binding protein [Halalkalibacter krulwichiae]ARK32641.1 Oligopeptide transport ATP-binding protein OppD [Halalkalibacter krulwichiae]
MSLLKVDHLKTHFYTDRGKITAVRDVSFSVDEGEIIGIVGESGCGKSVMAQSLIRLLEHTDPIELEGEVFLEGRDLLRLPLKEMRNIRGNDISMIFQDPLTSLNPVYTIGDQIIEVLRVHQKLSKKEARIKAIELLKLTGIPAAAQRVDEYPHQLSGGMQQRVMIAIALACRPKLLIADEPTTALDVTIQAQILELIKDLNQEFGMSVLFITHDLGVVASLCTNVKVMYLGQVVEESPTDQLFKQPLHPYTQMLLKSTPKMDGDRHAPLHVIKGTVPSLTNIPKGCSFSTRCPYATNLCKEEEPPTIPVDGGQSVKCWLYDEEKGGWHRD